MATNYYTKGTNITAGTTARSADVNTEFSGIETGFSKLPANVAATKTNVAVFAPETGSGNAYVVTMPDTRTVNANGDEIVFFATHGNTGASTLNVDGIGAKSLKDHAGVDLTSGAIVSGRLYTTRYDNANGYFVIATTVGQVVTQTNVKGTSISNPESSASNDFNAKLSLQNANSLPIADVGFEVSRELIIRNHVWGGAVKFAADSTTGVKTDFMSLTAVQRQVLASFGTPVMTPIGYSHAVVQIKNANYSLVDEDSGTTLVHTDAVERTYSVDAPPIGTWITGFWVRVVNLGTADVIIADVGTTLQMVDGSGGATTASSFALGQFRVPQGGSCYIMKLQAGEFFEIVDPVGISVPLKNKTADTSLVSSTTLTDDAHLLAWNEVVANSRYSIEGFVHYTQNIGDFKCTFQSSSVMQSGAITYQAIDSAGAIVSDHFNDITGVFAAITMGDTLETGLTLKGYFKTHATVGPTLDFQWAQNTSSVNGTTVREGSWIKIEKMK